MGRTCPLRMVVSFKFCLSSSSRIRLMVTESRSFEVVIHALYRFFWYSEKRFSIIKIHYRQIAKY